MSMEGSKLAKTLQTAMVADIDTLFATIGYIDSQSEIGVAPTDKKSLIERGKLWFREHEKQLQSHVCDNPRIQEFVSPKNEQASEIQELILVVADLIVSVCGGIPAIYVATLIIKIGIRKWCNVSSFRE